MERRTAKVTSISRGTSESANRAKPVVTGRRPSRSRSTEAMTGTCKVCGGNSWDADDIRGETICADCGYVAAENMIDPGAEWVNHSGGDDRSRVGAPTTLTLS
ncbi:MAG TPA: TFIIB-type zinc ribbon-containing protein, partial [Candidatus Thalassarchaeaceae archaeon]|nr:TFIIB-type zinc ribbon-containing protein [Candidatus Thalassarchaeaceae archaeon]